MILLVSVIFLFLISCKKSDDTGVSINNSEFINSFISDTTTIYCLTNDSLFSTSSIIKFSFPFIHAWQSKNIVISDAVIIIPVKTIDSLIIPKTNQLFLYNFLGTTKNDSLCKSVLDTLKQVYHLNVSKNIQTLINNTSSKDYFSIRGTYNQTDSSLISTNTIQKIKEIRLILKYIKY